VLGKHLVDQQRATLGHALETAAGTRSPPFAAERRQVLGITGFATHPQKPMLETPALEVVLEPPFHVP